MQAGLESYKYGDAVLGSLSHCFCDASVTPHHCDTGFINCCLFPRLIIILMTALAETLNPTDDCAVRSSALPVYFAADPNPEQRRHCQSEGGKDVG